MEHDDNISNPTRVGSGRWAGFLFECILAFVAIGLVFYAVPIGVGIKWLIAVLIILPWIVLAWARPRTQMWMLIRRLYLLAWFAFAFITYITYAF